MEHYSLLAARRSLHSLSSLLCRSCLLRYAFRQRSRAPAITKSHAAAPKSYLSHQAGPQHRNDVDDPPQAYPLTGYYSDILSPEFRRTSRARTARTTTQPATRNPPAKETAAKAKAEETKTKEEKMAIVFGTRLAGPGYQSTRYNPETMPPESTWKTINGVAIPPRPVEPDNCCMSGCVHCVWDDYREDLEDWARRVNEAKARGATATATAAGDGGGAHNTSPTTQSRPEVHSASTSVDDDGGGSEANWSLPQSISGEELFKDIPVGIREFMKTEKKLREKRQKQEKVAYQT